MSKVVKRIIGGMEMIARGIIGLAIAIVMSIIGLIVTICVIGILAVAVFIDIIATMFGMDKTVDMCDEIIDKIVEYLENKWD